MGATTPAMGEGATDRALRPLLGIGAAIGVLVIAAIAAVVLLGPPRATTYPPDSPEGVFQRYLQAFDAGDLDAAYAFFSRRVQSSMTLSEFIDASTGWMTQGEASRRTWIDRVDRADDRATLHLTVEQFYESGLQSSRYRYGRDVRLVLEDGSWRIDERLVGLEASY